MKRTQQILLMELVVMVVLSLLTIILYETDTLTAGVLSGDNNRQFLVTIVMELLTVGMIPLALYFFRIGRIHQSLVSSAGHGAKSLLLWGTVRMMMICMPMLLNTLFYYLFGYQVSFGYMAIILFLCLFMIYPSMGRCLNETEQSAQ